MERVRMTYLSVSDVRHVRRGMGILLMCAAVEEVGVCGFAVYEAVAAGSDDAAILAACLLLSYVFRCLFVVALVREKALEFLQQPSSKRAVNLALTCPFQVYLVAHVVGIEGAVALGMLCVAQFCSSALILVLEVEIASGEFEEAAARVAATPEMQVGTSIRGPQADLSYLSTHKMRANWAWCACLVCSGALHISVWTVIFGHFAHAGQLRTNVHLLVGGQFSALTLVWLVPVTHRGLRWVNEWNLEEEFVALSVVHAVLDITAKILLAAAFLMP